MARYNLGAVAPRYRGVYNATTTYNRLDIVEYQGNCYMFMNSASMAGQTPVKNANWNLISRGLTIVENALPSDNSIENNQVVVVVCP